MDVRVIFDGQAHTYIRRLELIVHGMVLADCMVMRYRASMHNDRCRGSRRNERTCE